MWKVVQSEDFTPNVDVSQISRLQFLYRSFLDQVPENDPTYRLAAARLETLDKLETKDNSAKATAKNLDEEAWQRAKAANTREAYQKYVSAHAWGTHFSEAIRELGPASTKTCVLRKLKQRGYDDGIDCIMNYEDPVCKNISRYNAEVDASNECR